MIKNQKIQKFLKNKTKKKKKNDESKIYISLLFFKLKFTKYNLTSKFMVI